METDDIPTSPPTEWHPTTNKADLAHLGKLGEELAECAAAASRCIIQGIDEAHPVTGKTNRQWLEEEIADVVAMIDHTVNHFGLDGYRIGDRQTRKYAWRALWFESLRRVVEK